MTNRRIAFAAVVFHVLSLVSLHAQTPARQDRAGDGAALLQLGVAEAGRGNVTAARSKLSEAAQKLRAQDDLVGVWMAHVLLAQIELATGRAAEAIPHAQRALAVLDEAKTSTAPFSLKTLTLIGGAGSLPPEMLQMLNDPQTASAVKNLMIQYSLEPLTHDLYGSALTQAGQLEKAEEELNAAVKGAVMSQGMYDFSIESHFGDLRFRQQRYDDARKHYVKALNASSKMSMLPMGSASQIQAGIYDRLVRLETITGHPEEAKRWAGKARELGKGQP